MYICVPLASPGFQRGLDLTAVDAPTPRVSIAKGPQIHQQLTLSFREFYSESFIQEISGVTWVFAFYRVPSYQPTRTCGAVTRRHELLGGVQLEMWGYWDEAGT